MQIERFKDIDIRESDGSIIIKLKVRPRSSKNEIIGVQEGALKLRLTSPPVEGRANADCLVFLSRVFGIRKRDMELISGKKGRDKRMKIFGVTKEEFSKLLNNFRF